MYKTNHKVYKNLLKHNKLSLIKPDKSFEVSTISKVEDQTEFKEFIH